MTQNPRCSSCYTCQKCVTCQIMKGKGDGGGLTRGPYPITGITLFPTDHCNFRCTYCFTYEYEREFTGRMNWDTAKQSIDFLLKNSGNNRMVSIHFFGGEPLLEYDLIKRMVKYGDREAKKYNKEIRWGMTSNCSLITRDINSFLRKHKFKILASIDGWRESHNTHRVDKEGKGTFDRVIRGIKMLKEWRTPELRWTLTPQTLKYVSSDIRKLVDMGFSSFALEPVYEIEWTEDDYDEYERMLRDVSDFLLELAAKNKTIHVKPIVDGLLVFQLNTRMRDRCGLAKGSVGVSPSGEIFRCHRFVGQYAHKIGDVWKGIDVDKAAVINSSWDINKVHPVGDEDQEKCKNCRARVICTGGCLAVNYDLYKDIFTVPEVYCKLNEIKVKVATDFYLEMINKYPLLLNRYMKLRRRRSNK